MRELTVKEILELTEKELRDMLTENQWKRIVKLFGSNDRIWLFLEQFQDIAKISSQDV